MRVCGTPFLFVVLGMLTVLPSVMAAANCQAPFVTILGQYCLHVGISFPLNGRGSPVTWEQARQKCQSLGSDLAYIKNADVLQAVSEYIDSTYVPETQAGYIYWVGGSGQGTSWSWVNGEPLSTTSHLWTPTRPDIAHTAAHYTILVPADSTQGRRSLYDYSATQVGPAYLCGLF